MTNTQPDIDVSKLIEAIGRKKLRTSLGLTNKSISLAKRANQFPANWFRIVRALAEEVGIDTQSTVFIQHFAMREKSPDNQEGSE